MSDPSMQECECYRGVSRICGLPATLWHTERSRAIIQRGLTEQNNSFRWHKWWIRGRLQRVSTTIRRSAKPAMSLQKAYVP